MPDFVVFLLLSGAVLLIGAVIALARHKIRQGALAFLTSPPVDPHAAQATLAKTCAAAGWECINYSRPSGENLSMVYARAPKSKYLIVLSHGRGGCLVSQDGDGVFTEHAKVKTLLGLGADVLCYDYSGFGASGGERSESNFIADCANAFQYAQEELQWPREKIVPVGQSLGTGVLLQYLAKNHGFAGVILFHPYRSIAATKSVMLARTLFRYIDYFRSEDVIGQVEGPVLVVHADSDLAVPYHNGEYLANALSKTGQLYALETLRGIPSSDAHARLFRVEQHSESIRRIVRPFLDSLGDWTGKGKGK